MKEFRERMKEAKKEIKEKKKKNIKSGIISIDDLSEETEIKKRRKKEI
jgi:hypothetical protein